MKRPDLHAVIKEIRRTDSSSLRRELLAALEMEHLVPEQNAFELHSALTENVHRYHSLKELRPDERQAERWGLPSLEKLVRAPLRESLAEVDGVSAISCCMNRNENLVRALPSWLALDSIDEIIIVDWSSDIPVCDSLAAANFEDPRIRVVEVESEPRWILSFAYNLAAAFASYSRVLKLDADYVLSPDFFACNALPRDGFCAGNWRLADSDQEHINGAVYCWRDHLFGVAGYNENIRTYGWDDDDLYNRLTLAGVVRYDLDPKTITHLVHPDAMRRQAASEEPTAQLTPAPVDLRVSIVVNRLFTEIQNYWSLREAPQTYSLIKVSEAKLQLKRLETPCPETFNMHRETAAALAVLEDVRSQGAVQQLPRLPEVMRQLAGSEAEELVRRYGSGAAAVKPVEAKPEHKLYVRVEHGLGNRLRALVSGMVIAEQYNRQLVVIWCTDDHCEAQLDDLLIFDGLVLDEPPASHGNHIDPIATYDLMDHEGSLDVGREINFALPLDIFVRTSARIRNPSICDASIRAKLSELRFAEPVQAIIDQVCDDYAFSVHVRMGTAMDASGPSYDSPANWSAAGHEKLVAARAKSHFSHFFTGIDRELASDPEAKFFLASDTLAAADAMKDRYGGRVISLDHRKLEGRSKEQLQGALADMWLLSRANKGVLLGSAYSSYTEMATMFNDDSMTLWVVGVDF